MTPQVEVAKPKAVEPEFTEWTRLCGAYFVSSVPFASEAMSVQVGRNCDSITPAALGANGRPVELANGQRADGIVLRRRVHNRGTNVRFVEMQFVPFANVKSLLYGE